jgi:hypothetical protein
MSDISKPEKDAFDQWWEWANKDRATDYRTIPSEIHYPVMMLTPEERKDRAIVNEALCTQMRARCIRPGARIGMEAPKAEEP